MVDGTLCYIALIEGSEIFIPRDHPQTCRGGSCEIGLDARAAGPTLLVVAGAVLVIDSL